VSLSNESSRVDLVVGDDERAEAHRVGGRRDLHRRQQVGRTIGTSQGGVAHGTGDDDRSNGAYEQLKGERRLFHGVGALRDHDPSRSGGKALVDRRANAARSFKVRSPEGTWPNGLVSTSANCRNWGTAATRSFASNWGVTPSAFWPAPRWSMRLCRRGRRWSLSVVVLVKSLKRFLSIGHHSRVERSYFCRRPAPDDVAMHLEWPWRGVECGGSHPRNGNRRDSVSKFWMMPKFNGPVSF